MSPQTFTRACRLKDAKDFARVKENGVRVRAGCVRLAVVSGGSPRIGIIVTKKTGAAVTRNRVRRVAREFFRAHRARMFSGDFVVVIVGVGANLENKAVRHDLAAAFTKLRALVENV